MTLRKKHVGDGIILVEDMSGDVVDHKTGKRFRRVVDHVMEEQLVKERLENKLAEMQHDIKRLKRKKAHRDEIKRQRWEVHPDDIR